MEIKKAAAELLSKHFVAYNQTIFTSGVSKMCLTCIRLVMCQVYFETEASGSPSSLTSADKRNSVSITFPYIFPIDRKFSEIKIAKSNRTVGQPTPVVKLGSLFFLEPRDRRCCRASKNSCGMWYTRGSGFPDGVLEQKDC